MASTRSWLPRILRWIVYSLLIFILGSVLWVLAYRFVNPPITFTQMGDILAGNGARGAWMSIDRIDRDMVRAVIAGEDSKFCSHGGFDRQAIEAAMRRNARGGSVIRGGSTISQQTAKNAFLWQGGGYFRKGLEAWFTFLIEHLWDKRRIMEVYLNVAETGIGTYGVDAGAQRYFGHDASNLSRTEAARIAAIFPLPKRREAIAPSGFTRRYGNMLAARMGVVARDRLDACVYSGRTAPAERPEPTVRRPAPLAQPRPLPGEEFERKAPAPAPVPPPSEPKPEPPSETNGV
ncbi:MAG: monofunctional glycosyltransferase [Sphingomonadales bacterium]|jgi:monofunctional biosynthetic peptidoglycan transglycosylase|nr:monofunctional glycosyltransferase [Sphingomonadales bacterium]